MIVNNNDRKILKYIEDWNYITGEQATHLLGRNKQHQKKHVYKRLNHLADKNFLIKNVYEKRFFGDNKKNLYSNKPVKENEYPKLHSMLLMDYFCYLHTFFTDVEIIAKEYDWKPIKVVSDALISFKYRDSYYYQIVEIVASNHKDNFDKYIDVYESNLFQNMVGEDIFPLIVVVDNRKRNFNHAKHEPLQFVFLDHKFNGFEKILNLL